jgi:predicted hydrolase (HD superfamily)
MTRKDQWRAPVWRALRENEQRKGRIPMGETMPTRDEAWALLPKYNTEDFHLRHAETVEASCGTLRDGGVRGRGGLLGGGRPAPRHRLEKWPEEHLQKSPRIHPSARGLPERLIHAVVSHGWGICADEAPEHFMEKILFATTSSPASSARRRACARPGASRTWSWPSLKKKFKDKKFAAGCSRDVIRKGAELSRVGSGYASGQNACGDARRGENS